MQQQKDIFHQYQLLRHPDGELWRIGRSRTGVTYKAQEIARRTYVALKVFHHRFTDYSSIRSLACFDHPTVARLLYVGRQGGQDFCVNEFVEGESLDSLIRRSGPLSANRALQVIAQLVQALVAAHSRGLVHRDLKPAHIIVPKGATEVVKLVGFQISDTRVAGEVLAGALDFESPEQIEGSDVDVRSDIYSLGLTLLFLVSGQTPGPGGSPLRAVTLPRQHGNEFSTIPEPIRDLLKIMLADDRSERVATAVELSGAVAACERALLLARAVEVEKVPPAEVESVQSASESPEPMASALAREDSDPKVTPSEGEARATPPVEDPAISREETAPVAPPQCVVPQESPEQTAPLNEVASEIEECAPCFNREIPAAAPPYPPRLPPKLLPRLRPPVVPLPQTPIGSAGRGCDFSSAGGTCSGRVCSRKIKGRIIGAPQEVFSSVALAGRRGATFAERNRFTVGKSPWAKEHCQANGNRRSFSQSAAVCLARVASPLRPCDYCSPKIKGVIHGMKSPSSEKTFVASQMPSKSSGAFPRVRMPVT